MCKNSTLPAFRRRKRSCVCGPGATSGGIISRRQLEYNQKQCRKRALQRWSTLVTADTSRISKLMRAQLGEHWAYFVRYANKRYKQQFVEAFMPASNVLRCSGPSPGVPCPEAYTVDLNTAESLDKLPGMHLDHDCDLKRVCDRWSRALPEKPRCWSEGVDREVLCELLFKVDTANQLRHGLHLRCDIPSGHKLSTHFSGAPFCHDTGMAHYGEAPLLERLCC